jgi:hypothetical protein
MVDSPKRTGRTHHFLKAKGLGAKLDVVVLKRTARAVLHFHGIGYAFPYFHPIGLATQTQPFGT